MREVGSTTVQDGVSPRTLRSLNRAQFDACLAPPPEDVVQDDFADTAGLPDAA
jgi:hypothetical protein